MADDSGETVETKRRRYIARAEEADRAAATREGEARERYLRLAENWRDMAAKLGRE